MLLNRRVGETGVDPMAERRRDPDSKALYPPPAERERHVYAPPASRRWIGLLGTGAVYAVMLAAFLLTVRHHVAPSPPAAPLVVDLLPLASPPIEEKQVKPAPEEKQQKQEPAPPKIQPPELVPTPIAVRPLPAPAPATQAVVDPRPKEPETVAPKVIPAPPAPAIASNAPDTWEGRLLAALEKHKRYPVVSRGRREQGVVYVKFRMNRAGRVLSASIARGSGFAALDREALATLRRAEPLPKIPPGKPDEVELSVPVEFFIN